jgi:diguanylate cyclase (GGDEF)-like protein
MAAWIAVAAGVAALLFAVTAAFLARRAAALEEELRRAAARQEARRELSGSLDLDDVVARILEESLALDDVDAATLSLEGEDHDGMVKSAGMSLEEAERHGESGSKLSLPLHGDLGSLGSLIVYSGSVRDLERRIGADLADLARRAAPALDNAFRYREARRLADTDGLTGLRNRRYFHDTLQRECTRAHRYGRSLALLVLDLDDFKTINERLGHLAGDAVLAETASRLRAVLRASDVACRIGGDEFAIVLPEAGAQQAAQLYRRVEDAVSAKPIGTIAQLTLSGGVAELAERDDARSFFERADEALYRAKSAGKAQLYVSEEPGATATPEAS